MPTLKNKNKSKIIAVDFDGTLCKFDFPNIGKQLKKHKELLEILIDLRKKGHKLILWTNRGDNEKYPVLRFFLGYSFHLIDYILSDYVNEQINSKIYFWIKYLLM